MNLLSHTLTTPFSGRSVSPDNKILAYGVDTVSRRQYSIHFKYLENGEHAEDVIPNTTGGAAWANDNKTVFYTRKDPVSLRSYRIYRHELGTDVEKDVLVYEETDELYGCFVSRLRSGKYLTHWIIQHINQRISTHRYREPNCSI